MVEARYAIGRSLWFLLSGLALLLANSVQYLQGQPYSPAMLAAGAVLTTLGARVLDRRVRLRVGPDGFFYATWRALPFPWDEFERFRLFKHNFVDLLEVVPRQPAEFERRLSVFLRFGSWVNRRVGRPPLFVNPVLLNVNARDVLTAVRENGGPAA